MWDALGIVDGKRFFVTSRGDWVGKYQGYSVAKAKKLIQKARGGVIFIDEAYSLIAKDVTIRMGTRFSQTFETMTSPIRMSPLYLPVMKHI